MSAGARKPVVTLDTNLAGVWNTRVFWGTLCEEIGQTLLLTPTAASETLHRVRLECERQWTKKLREINDAGGHGWRKVEVRRLATLAAGAARDWLQGELRNQGGIYASPRTAGEETERLEAEIDELMDDRAFDLDHDNGIRDRKIVIEAMARGHDILASNNINSIDHGMLRTWLKSTGEPQLGIRTTVLRPEPAEEAIRNAFGKPIEWTAYAAARACVSNPYDEVSAGAEIDELLEGFENRGWRNSRAASTSSPARPGTSPRSSKRRNVSARAGRCARNVQ